MEGGLRDLALLAMSGAGGGDHAFAEQQLGASLGALFHEVGGLHDEDFADVLGIIEKNDVLASDPVVANVAVPVDEVLEVTDGVRQSPPPESLPGEVLRHSGWKAVAGGRLRSELKFAGGHVVDWMRFGAV